MPAKSKAQQQMFGIAHAIQKGTMPASKARGPATDVAKAAKPKDVKDFASTSTKNLPKKVKKEDVQRIREYVTKVVREVLAEGRGITTKMWKDAGEPFEIWLRYSQASSSQKAAVEKLFAKKYPHLKEAQSIKPQRYTMKQDEESGDWYVWDGKTLHKSFDSDDRSTASRTLWTLRKNENLTEWSVASPNAGAGQSEWEIWNGGKIRATAPNKEAATKLKNKMKLDEAYSRGSAVISINGRNGHVHWRTSDGQYDADLPGKRDKKFVQRRIAQIKKKLWGYDIKINDPDGMLKEANWQHGGRRGGPRGETPEVRGDRERRDARAMAQQSKVSKSERARVSKERLTVLAQAIKTRKSARIGGVIVRAKDAVNILKAMKNHMTPNLRDSFLSMTPFDKVIRTSIMLNK